MIDFHYKTLDDEVLVTLKTDVTEIGTFHRMASVIFLLGWDIISGEILTITENGIEYAIDTLRLKTESNMGTKKAVEIGLMMDAIFSKRKGLDELFQMQELKVPVVKNFFRERAELIFQDDFEKKQTCFYIEADSGRGLLYHVTKVLLENKINILTGVIETDKITQRAKDTFYLLDHEGKMFGETKKAEEIRTQILKPLFNQ
jgi:UTP:GlnB (protein PII) uridylyltransferase